MLKSFMKSLISGVVSILKKGTNLRNTDTDTYIKHDIDTNMSTLIIINAKVKIDFHTKIKIN